MSAIRFEKLRVENRATGEVIVSKSVEDEPNGLKFCVKAPPDRTPLTWEIWVKKLEPPYEGSFAGLVWDVIEPDIGITLRTGYSKFYISPYVVYRTFGPYQYNYDVKIWMTVETGTIVDVSKHGQVEDGYVLTFNPDLFVSEHDGETVYFPRYYCEILWVRERFPRGAQVIDGVKQRRALRL